MTQYEFETETLKRAVKDLPLRCSKSDPRNINRIAKFIKNYEKAKKEILEEEND